MPEYAIDRRPQGERVTERYILVNVQTCHRRPPLHITRGAEPVLASIGPITVNYGIRKIETGDPVEKMMVVNAMRSAVDRRKRPAHPHYQMRFWSSKLGTISIALAAL